MTAEADHQSPPTEEPVAGRDNTRYRGKQHLSRCISDYVERSSSVSHGLPRIFNPIGQRGALAIYLG